MIIYLASLIPMEIFLSHLYVSKPSLLSSSETKLTWELSMACKDIPVELQSHVASFSKSFTAAMTFFSSEPCTRRASNMVVVVCVRFIQPNE